MRSKILSPFGLRTSLRVDTEDHVLRVLIFCGTAHFPRKWSVCKHIARRLSKLFQFLELNVMRELLHHLWLLFSEELSFDRVTFFEDASLMVFASTEQLEIIY